MAKPKFLTTGQFADRIGKSRSSGWRFLQRHPGFSINVGGQHRVPEQHLIRLLSGEPIEAIVAEARSIGAPRAA